MSNDLYFDDFTPGQVFTTGEYILTQEEIIRFAAQYDPQYFHTDPEAATSGPFGRLIASGWNTAAVSMRLKTQTPLGEVAGGLLGIGMDMVKWPRPVFAGDTLHVVITIVDTRTSASRPTHGIVKYRTQTYNQQSELVMEAVINVWVPLRSPLG